ncbi:hypothetical protein SE17_19670 [Kouleothrix aurantiaca]|uniref:DUF2231 domain-containing protein n=1 Tax=Kouleothrix aurantiaca TaxID=186479 RepID=A0A0P9CZ15_9CHLR|nr:hypothetical protein SE17_19670 [Kouleothrix aurantiaca]
MYPFHPLTAHLPIGLLLGNAALTALYLRRGDRAYETSAFHCLWLGWLGALLAVALGVFDAARFVLGAGVSGSTLAWVNAHALVGAAILVVYWQAWQMRRRAPGILDDLQARRGYLVRLGLGVALLVLDGWLGGHLVYSLRLGVAP